MLIISAFGNSLHFGAWADCFHSSGRAPTLNTLHISLRADGSLPGYEKMFYSFNKLRLASQLHKENSNVITRSSQVCSSQECSNNYSWVLNVQYEVRSHHRGAFASMSV